MKTVLQICFRLAILLLLSSCRAVSPALTSVSSPPAPTLPAATFAPSPQLSAVETEEARDIPDPAEVKALLARLVDTEQRATAMVIGMISSNPSARWVVGHGQLSKMDSRVPDGDTVFEIASISKVYTGTLLGIAVHKGEVKLADSITKYLPGNAVAPKFQGLPITLRDLATHTSGLPNMPANFNPADRRNPFADYTFDQMYEFLSSYELPRQPGLEYEYSNYGMSLLGNLLVRVAGQPDYETLLVQRICAPLGMNSTRVRFTPSMQSRLAPPHNSVLTPDYNWDLPTFAGAGGIRSTANDMLKFLAANLGIDSPADISPAVEIANTPYWPTDPMNSRETKIGLAWNITTKYGSTIHWHNGQTGGYHSFLGWDPEKKIGVVILANSPVYNEDVGFHLLNPSYELSPHAPRVLPRQVTVDPQVLTSYVGQYQLDEYTILTIRAEGSRLFLSQNNIPGAEFELFGRSETDFYQREADVEITFVKNDQGKIVKILYVEDGVDYIAINLKK